MPEMSFARGRTAAPRGWKGPAEGDVFMDLALLLRV